MTIGGGILRILLILKNLPETHYLKFKHLHLKAEKQQNDG